MGWRFRKSIELFDGLRVYITQRGISSTARVGDTGLSHNQRLVTFPKGESAADPTAMVDGEGLSALTSIPDVDASGAIDGEALVSMIDPESAVGCLGCMAGCFIGLIKLFAVCLVLWLGFSVVSGVWDAGQKRLKASKEAVKQAEVTPSDTPAAPPPPLPVAVPPVEDVPTPVASIETPVAPPPSPSPTVVETKETGEADAARLEKARKRLNSAKGQSSPYARITLLKGVVRDYPGTDLAKEASDAIAEAEKQIAEREGRSR